VSDKEKSFITPAQRYPSPTATATNVSSRSPSPQTTSPPKTKQSSLFDLSTRKEGRVSNDEIEEWKMKLRSPIEDLEEGALTTSKTPLAYPRKSQRSPIKRSSTPSKSNANVGSRKNDICASPATPKTAPIPVSQSTLLSHREEKKQTTSPKDRVSQIRRDLSTGRLSSPMVSAAVGRKQVYEKGISPLNQHSRHERSIGEQQQLPHSTVTHVVDKPVVMTTRISKRILVNFFFSYFTLTPLFFSQ